MHDLMASIWEKAISILAGNLNSSRSYLITAALKERVSNPSLVGRKGLLAATYQKSGDIFCPVHTFGFLNGVVYVF